MKEPTYSNALRESWRLTWEHKSLWSFGLFAMLLGQLGVAELLFKVGMSSRTGEVGGFWTYLIFCLNPMNWYKVFQAMPKHMDTVLWFFWMIIILTGLAAVVAFVAVVCQGAIIHAAAQYTKKKKGLPDEWKAWHVAVKHFWKLFWLNVLRKLVLFMCALAVAWATIYAAVLPGFGNWVFFLVFIAAVFIGMVLSIVLIYAAGYVLEEEYTFAKAINAAIHLLSGHWLVSFEVGLILLFMNSILLILLFVGLVYLFFLPILIAANIGPMSGSSEILRAGGLFAYMLFGLYAVTLVSIFTVYINTCWTYLFMKMHKEGVESRLKHYLGFKQKSTSKNISKSTKRSVKK